LIVVRPETWTWQSASRQAARFVPSFALGGGVGLGFGAGGGGVDVGGGGGVGVRLGVVDDAAVVGDVAFGVPELSLEPQAVSSSAAASDAVITFMPTILLRRTAHAR
jgi:hypothetical protein